MEISEGGKFKIGRNIGSGTFGEIYLGKIFMHIIRYFNRIIKIIS